VIVSMGNLAGSGGYFVAMNADRIVAQPGTITASIGVFGGKLLTREFWNKLGITWDDVGTSKHSALWNTHHDYEGSEYERFQAMLDRIYEDFTAKVAEGRELDLDQVRELARGRIWTGEDAKELGLVDELGGYETALRLAREEIGVEQDAPIRIKRFPRKRSAWELFLGEPPDSSEGAAMQAWVRALRKIQPAMRALKQLGLTEEPPGLVMPEVTAAAP
jgi:protease-4